MRSCIIFFFNVQNVLQGAPGNSNGNSGISKLLRCPVKLRGLSRPRVPQQWRSSSISLHSSSAWWASSAKLHARRLMHDQFAALTFKVDAMHSAICKFGGSNFLPIVFGSFNPGFKFPKSSPPTFYRQFSYPTGGLYLHRLGSQISARRQFQRVQACGRRTRTRPANARLQSQLGGGRRRCSRTQKLA